MGILWAHTGDIGCIELATSAIAFAESQDTRL